MESPGVNSRVRTACLGCDTVPTDGILHRGPDKEKNLCAKCSSFWRLHGILRSKQVVNGALKPEYASALAQRARDASLSPLTANTRPPPSPSPGYGTGRSHSRRAVTASHASPGARPSRDSTSPTQSQSSPLIVPKRPTPTPASHTAKARDNTMPPHSLLPDSAPQGGAQFLASSGARTHDERHRDNGMGRGAADDWEPQDDDRSSHATNDDDARSSGVKRQYAETSEGSVADAGEAAPKAKAKRVSGTSKLLRLLHVDMVEGTAPTTSREDRRRRAQRQRPQQPSARDEKPQKRFHSEKSRSATPGLDAHDGSEVASASTTAGVRAGARAGASHLGKSNKGDLDGGAGGGRLPAGRPQGYPLGDPMGPLGALGADGEARQPDAFAILGIGQYCDLRGSLASTHPLARPSFSFLDTLEERRKQLKERQSQK